MKQKDKSKISKDKIINSAIAEFGTKAYENASLNSICSENNISKGLIYHYFKNKDELFLECVRLCFQGLVDHLGTNNLNKGNFKESMQGYINSRYEFFQENTHLGNIFFQTLLQPPFHLKSEIKNLRRELDEFNLEHYKTSLNTISLREGISKEEALEYFVVFQEMFNAYFQTKLYEGYDFNLLVKDHEVNISKLLNIVLYGIAEGEEKR